MSSINAKLGLRPRTRARAATHGSALASGVRCPTCGSSHVIRRQATNASTDFMCGFGHFFNLEDTMSDDPKPTDETPTPTEGDTKPEETAPAGDRQRNTTRP